MSELEGLSYDSIGNRMGLTRGAVESLLFRARRRLRDGFDEIDTGARCESMQGRDGGVADGSARARDRRRLSSHLHHCKPCRRHAVAMGLDSLVLGARAEPRAPGRSSRRGLPAAAGLPAPPARRRSGGLGPAAQAGVEQGATLAGKATAVVVAAVVAAGGAGVAHKAAGGCVAGRDLPWWATPAAATAARAARALGGGQAEAVRPEAAVTALPVAQARSGGMAGGSGPAGPNGPAGGGRAHCPGGPGRPARRGTARRDRRPGEPARPAVSRRRSRASAAWTDGRVRRRRRGRLAQEDDQGPRPAGTSARVTKDVGNTVKKRRRPSRTCRKAVKEVTKTLPEAEGQGAERGQAPGRRLGEHRRGGQDRPVRDASRRRSLRPACRRCSCRRCPADRSPPGLGL